MDAIVVEVLKSLGPGVITGGLPTMTRPALPHTLLRARSLEPRC
jgi:hypothetical protein